MQRIAPVNPATATGPAKDLLDGIKAAFGAVPNLYRTTAHSPAALQGLLNLHQGLDAGTFDGKLKESIALATAGYNGCEYCAAAHSFLGKKAGLDAAETDANLHGHSSDPRTLAVITFARSLLRSRGRVSDDALQAIRAAGFGDGEIVEIVGQVVLNIYTNYLNNLFGTEVDFPKVVVPKAA